MATNTINFALYGMLRNLTIDDEFKTQCQSVHTFIEYFKTLDPETRPKNTYLAYKTYLEQHPVRDLRRNQNVFTKELIDDTKVDIGLLRPIRLDHFLFILRAEGTLPIVW